MGEARLGEVYECLYGVGLRDACFCAHVRVSGNCTYDLEAHRFCAASLCHQPPNATYYLFGSVRHTAVHRGMPFESERGREQVLCAPLLARCLEPPNVKQATKLPAAPLYPEKNKMVTPPQEVAYSIPGTAVPVLYFPHTNERARRTHLFVHSKLLGAALQVL